MANFLAHLIGCSIFFLPYYTRFSTFNVDRVSKAMLFLLLIPLFVLLDLKKQRKIPIEIKIGIAICILHIIIFQFEPASFSGMFSSIAISLGAIFFVKYHESYVNEDIVLNYLTVGGLSQCAVAISQHLGFDIYSNLVLLLNRDIYVKTEEINLFGSFANSNLFGAYLSLCAPSLFRGGLFFMLPLLIVFIFLSKSMMAIAALIFAITLFFKKDKEIWFYVAAPVLFSLALLIFPNESSGRIELWGNLINQIGIKHFLFGMSSSWFDSLGLKIGINYVNNEHNEFLSVFNIFGIFGLAFFAYLFVKSSFNSGKNIIFGCITLASFVNMLGNFTLHYAPLALIAIVSISHCIKGKYVSNLDR